MAETRTNHTMETMPAELRGIAYDLGQEGYGFVPLVLLDAGEMLDHLRAALSAAEARAERYRVALEEIEATDPRDIAACYERIARAALTEGSEMAELKPACGTCGRLHESWQECDWWMRAAWMTVAGSVDLKRCPDCGTHALEGEVACSACGAEPADDMTWRELSTLRAELAAARERVRELEEGLLPFAREADAWLKAAGDDFVPFISSYNSNRTLRLAEFTVGDLRRAQRLAAPTSAAHTGEG